MAGVMFYDTWSVSAVYDSCTALQQYASPAHNPPPPPPGRTKINRHWERTAVNVSRHRAAAWWCTTRWWWWRITPASIPMACKPPCNATEQLQGRNTELLVRRVTHCGNNRLHRLPQAGVAAATPADVMMVVLLQLLLLRDLPPDRRSNSSGGGAAAASLYNAGAVQGVHHHTERLLSSCYNGGAWVSSCQPQRLYYHAPTTA